MMQISERFRRGVVVPLDDAAAKELEDDQVGEATRVRFIEIADQAEFEELWKTGVFRAINESTGRMVDDYEEEVIPLEMVPRVREVAGAYAEDRAGSTTGGRFFAALLEACALAERSGMPIYFIL